MVTLFFVTLDGFFVSLLRKFRMFLLQSSRNLPTPKPMGWIQRGNKPHERYFKFPDAVVTVKIHNSEFPKNLIYQLSYTPYCHLFQACTMTYDYHYLTTLQSIILQFSMTSSSNRKTDDYGDSFELSDCQFTVSVMEDRNLKLTLFQCNKFIG